MNKLSIEDVIQEAQKEGKFSDLPGKGKPLHLDPSPDAVINNLLKDANVKPEWVEVAQEIETLLDNAEKLLAQYEQQHAADFAALQSAAAAHDEHEPVSAWRQWWQRLLFGNRQRSVPDRLITTFNGRWDTTIARYASLLHRTNTKIRRFNDLVPGIGRQRSLLDVTQLLNDFVQKYPRVREVPGDIEAVRGTVSTSLLALPSESKSSGLPRDLQAGRIIHHVQQSKRSSRCSK